MWCLTPIANTFSFSSIICKCKASNDTHNHALDAGYIRRAALIADKSAGFTSPHPNFGCVIATPSGDVAGEGYLYAQGTSPAEVQAVTSAGDRCRGATAYLNMEPGDCDGDNTAVSALLQVSCYSNFVFVADNVVCCVQVQRCLCLCL